MSEQVPPSDEEVKPIESASDKGADKQFSDESLADSVPKENLKTPAVVKRKRGFFGRSVRLFFESLAVLLGLSLMGILVLGWIISRGPVSADFLLPYIQKALNDVQGQMEVSLGALELEWHGWSSPIGLKALDIKLKNDHGPFMDVEQAALDISLSDILSRNIQFRAATIKGLSARVEKQMDGSIRLFNEDKDAYGPKTRTSPLTLEKIILNLPPIYELRIEDAQVEYADILKNTSHMFNDVTLEVKQDDLSDKGRDVTGFLTVTLGGDKEKNVASLDFIYNQEALQLDLSGRLGETDVYSMAEFIGVADVFDNNDIGVNIPVEARMNITLTNSWGIQNFSWQALTKSGSLTLPDVPQGKLDIGRLNMSVAYDPTAQTLSLYETDFQIAGIDMALQADLQLPSKDAPDVMSGDMKLDVKLVNIDDLDNLVPQKFDHEPLYKWLVERISTGNFTDIAFGARLLGHKRAVQAGATDEDISKEDFLSDAYNAQFVDYTLVVVNKNIVPIPPHKPDWTVLLSQDLQDEILLEVQGLYNVFDQKDDMAWHWQVQDTKANFKFEGLKIDYKEPMLPAEEAKGSGVLDGKALSLSIENARLGQMKVDKGRLFFDDLVTKGKGEALINLDVSTGLAGAFEYLSKDPINFGEKLGLDIKKAKGQAALDIEITFPTVKDLLVEDINVKVNGTMRDVTLPGVLNGLSLSGGPYGITATQNEYNMKGVGELDGRKITLDWHSYFEQGKGRPYESRIKASFVADEAFRKSIDVDLSEFLDGSVPVSIDMREYWNGTSELDVTGLVNRAILKIEPFDYITSPQNTGKVSANIKLNGKKLSSIENLEIDTKELTVQKGNITFAHDSLVSDVRIQKGVFSRIAFEQNDFGLQMEEERDGLMKLALNGKQLDARHFLAPEEAAPAEAIDNNTGKNEGFEVGLDVGGVLTVENEMLRNVDAYIKGQKGKISQLELDGVAGNGNVYVRYKPNMEDRYSLRIESSDAGAMLKAFGITDKVRGGKLTIAGLPLNTGYYGDVRGLARIDDFNVRAAPAFAGLLKLMDLPTVMTSMNKDGLSFARLETEFEWRNRRGGGIISFEDGRTSGGSIGLTFEGDINRTQDIIAMSGTIVPASTLNSFFSGIPLVGDLLSGGSGSIFAATYTVKGNTEEPEMKINPLSVLAPGILRKLLFEGGD